MKYFRSTNTLSIKRIMISLKNLFFIFPLGLHLSAQAQLPTPTSKTMTVEQAKAIAVKAYRGFTKPPNKNEYYRIEESTDQVALFYAYMGPSKTPTNFEKFIYKGVLPSCRYDEVGPDAQFTCHSLAPGGVDLFQSKLTCFGSGSITVSVKNDYIRFNLSTLSLEQVKDPALFERDRYEKNCREKLTTEICGPVIDSILDQLPQTFDWSKSKFDLAGISQENLKLLSALAGRGSLEIYLRQRFKTLQSLVLPSGETHFWIDVEKYDDDGAQTSVALGLSKAKAPLYIFKLNSGKYSGCRPGKKLKGKIQLDCRYAEGGEESNWKITIDLVKRNIK